jgi:hypothetical protein
VDEMSNVAKHDPSGQAVAEYVSSRHLVREGIN